MNSEVILNVYFVPDKVLLPTAYLIEDLITNDVRLEISNNAFLYEIFAFIGKVEEILKNRYQNVLVKINWNSGDKDVWT